LAAKANDSAAKIDLAAFEWSKACTACHPGGGGTEYDRDGFRYDVRAARNDWSANDGDYYGSDWGNSGVIEADCLLCHLDTYRTSRRAPLLAKAWHRAAPVEGAGMGVARDNSTIDYSATFALRIGPTPSKNCDQCHAAYEENDLLDLFNSPGNIKSDIAKRGRSSNDPHNPDVHEQAGMACTACHGAGEGVAGTRTVTKLEHQFRKGHVMVGSSVQDDLDNALGYKGCADCHTTGEQGAPPLPANALHASTHLSNLACETCHIPKKNFFAAAAFDFAEGQKIPFWRGGNPTNPHGGGFQPAYLWWRESPTSTAYRIYPFNGITAVFWNKGDQARNAFFLKQAAAAVAALPAGTLTNDVPDSGSVAEPNKAAEITALAAKLAELNPGTNPVLWIEPDWFQLSHNIAPKAQALGAAGCTDCHVANSPFFSREVQMIPANWPVEDVPGKVVMEVHVRSKAGVTSTIEGLNPKLPMWRLLGYTQQRKDELERER
jgi:hypothetical protein